MNILLGICGSISAYKTLDIARAWINNGHQVKVILTKGAAEFVLANTFKYLGIIEVYTAKDDFNLSYYNGNNNVLHIDLANWADRFVIAPLSAHTLGRLCNGLADDLLTCTFLALAKSKPIIVFPAMNTKMLEHPFVQENLDKLNTLENLFVHPTDFGLLVCGETGAGKFPSVNAVIENAININPFNQGSKLILISTGATVAPLDPVRYLTNPSSGLTGHHLAIEAHRRGYQVILLAGQYAHEKIDVLNYYPNLKVIRVLTTEEMRNIVTKYFAKADLYISAAAIGDIEFDITTEKLKKDQFMKSIPIRKSRDILKEILDLKTDKQKVVGFAAETNLSQAMLSKKWHAKPVDLLVGTTVHNGLIKNTTAQGFGTDRAEYKLFAMDEIYWQGPLTKTMLAKKIFEKVGF